MLGEKIGEQRGQVLVRRVLPGEGPPKVEVSFEAQGQLVGISSVDIGTYTSIIQPDGTIYGEGSGITRSADNSEIATWRGSGVGRSRHRHGLLGLLAVDLQAEARALQLEALEPVLGHQSDQLFDLLERQQAIPLKSQAPLLTTGPLRTAGALS